MRKFFFGSLFLFIQQIAFGQGFYDLNTIQDIRIYFGFPDWDYRMDTAKAGSEGYTPADSVVLNGITFTNCGVKYKGNSSYNTNRAKNPLHIKLDKYQQQDYQGYEDIKLGNGWSDNSMVREPLAYLILRQYMDAPLANFARVYINGSYYGIMNNAEDIDNRFLSEHYYSSKHTFFKCNPVDAGPGSGNGSSLEYNGTTLSNYDTRYELKSDTGWYELFQLCDTLNNYFGAFNSIADIDRFLWMLAFNNITVNLDSYTGAFRQNYYLYRNHANQWIPTVWDLNMCFGGFSLAGGITSNLNATTMQTMNHTLHKTESSWPLIYKLLNDPFYEKMYFAHMRTINEENFSNASYKAPAQAMQQLVDSAVQQDANYLGTYSDFQIALTTNTTGSMPGSTCPGIFPLMDARSAYIANVLSAAPPVISNVSNSPVPVFGASSTITAQVSNAASVYLGYRFAKQDRFVRELMYDDGQHGDGAAGDGVYGASVMLNSLTVQYYIYAENASTGAFSPARAEFEFYEINPSLAAAGNGQLVINELTANNSSGLQNEKGNYKDWIELYNTTGQALGLNGLYLSDLSSQLDKWPFPADAFIMPGQHLLLWADDDDQTFLDMHTNFNLSNTGDALYLSDGVAVFDSIVFSNQPANVAQARCADGVGSFTTVYDRSPREVNPCDVAVDELTQHGIAIFPNPATDRVQLSSDSPVQSVVVSDLHGRATCMAAGGEFSVRELQAGYYIVTVKTENGRLHHCRLLVL